MRVTLDTLKAHRFPGHGELSMDWEGAILHTQARGPFNLEMVQQGMRLLGALGSKLWPADDIVIELVHWHDSMLMPPDAIQYFEQKVMRFAESGRAPRHTLVVAAPDIEARWLMLPRVTKIWQRSRPVEVFESLEPALARASERLQQLRGSRAG
jgi:hypothetical protein